MIISETGATNGFLASPNYKRTFYDTGSNGPCLCIFKGKVFIGWTGTDSDVRERRSKPSRGAIAVYGHLG